VFHRQTSQFQQMMFELPAGTDFIEVKLEGEKGTHVAIQKIMLYQ